MHDLSTKKIYFQINIIHNLTCNKCMFNWLLVDVLFSVSANIQMLLIQINSIFHWQFSHGTFYIEKVVDIYVFTSSVRLAMSLSICR